MYIIFSFLYLIPLPKRSFHLRSILSRRCVRLRCFLYLVCVRRRSGSGRLPAASHPFILSSSGRCVCHSLYGGRLSVSRGISRSLFHFVRRLRLSFLKLLSRLLVPSSLRSHNLFLLRLLLYGTACSLLCYGYRFTPGSRALPIRISSPDRPVVLLRPRAAFLKRKGRAEPAPFLKKQLV